MEDTPHYEELSEECKKRILETKRDLHYDYQMLSQKIDSSLTAIRNELAEIDKYLSEANLKIHDNKPF